MLEYDLLHICKKIALLDMVHSQTTNRRQF